MGFSHFFVDRPIFASVLAIILTLVGAISFRTLAITEFPDIAPPTVEVIATYAGAAADVVAETVASPIEQEINGVDNMIYMVTQATGDGTSQIDVVFKPGTNIDQAQVLVQNRVAIAIPRLPEEVQRIGVTVKKKSPDLMMVVHLISPDGSLDSPSTTRPILAQRYPRYLLRPSDVLQLTFPITPEYDQAISIQPDGFVSLRGVGDLYIAGKSLPELSEALHKAYGSFLNDPIINVEIKDFEKPYFTAGGEFGKPGKYELRGDTTVAEAVAIAGGQEFADFFVERQQPDGVALLVDRRRARRLAADPIASLADDEASSL